jgi:hypothetical protein
VKRTTKKAAAKKSAGRKTPAKRATAARTRTKVATSRVATQVKTTAMKVLAGAASGAVQALIPPLEEAAGQSAKTAGTDTSASQQRRKPRK